MQVIGYFIIAAIVGLVGFLFFNGTIQVKDRQNVPVSCTPSEPPAPSRAYKSEANISLYDGKIQPERIELSGPIIFLSVTNYSPYQHNIVLAEVKNCKEKELRRIDGLINSLQGYNIRISLPPGEYILYCDIRVGKTTHRSNGEIAKVIVH
jgi:hypothetical protein